MCVCVCTHVCLCVCNVRSSLGPRPNQPQHGSLLVFPRVILDVIHALDKQSGNETATYVGVCVYTFMCV